MWNNLHDLSYGKMKVIHNCILPPGKFIAINLFGIVFVRNRFKKLPEETKRIIVNHEAIHTEQIKEWWYIGFYILYLMNYTYNLLKYKNFYKAYRNTYFEEEAYNNQDDLDYIKKRVRYNYINH